MAVPKDWNVVVIGAWNPAILTPGCIKEHVLGLEKNSVVEIQVPLDVPAHPRVKYNNVTVTVLGTQLIIGTDPSDKEGLKFACRAATQTISYLDKTPVTAAGVNIRYHFDELPDTLISSCRQKLDDDIADFGETVKQSITQKFLAFNSGLLNLSVTQTENASGVILLNFHRDSQNSGDLLNWLQDIDEIILKADEILNQLLK